jgi:hypothetical protein
MDEKENNYLFVSKYKGKQIKGKIKVLWKLVNDGSPSCYVVNGNSFGEEYKVFIYGNNKKETEKKQGKLEEIFGNPETLIKIKRK